MQYFTSIFYLLILYWLKVFLLKWLFQRSRVYHIKKNTDLHFLKILKFWTLKQNYYFFSFRNLIIGKPRVLIFQDRQTSGSAGVNFRHSHPLLILSYVSRHGRGLWKVSEKSLWKRLSPLAIYSAIKKYRGVLMCVSC